jgi:hypothetical protein
VDIILAGYTQIIVVIAVMALSDEQNLDVDSMRMPGYNRRTSTKAIGRRSPWKMGAAEGESLRGEQGAGRVFSQDRALPKHDKQDASPGGIFDEEREPLAKQTS